MTAMERAGIKKLIIKEKAGYELHLERNEEHPAPSHSTLSTGGYSPVFHHHPMNEMDSGPRAAVPHKSAVTQEEIKEKEGRYIASPMVGTFYVSSSPDDSAFIKVGDRVEENTVVCIIEAMKVMNEVKAGKSGVISEILVDNAHPVEFGTKIFRIT